MAYVYYLLVWSSPLFLPPLLWPTPLTLSLRSLNSWLTTRRPTPILSCPIASACSRFLALLVVEWSVLQQDAVNTIEAHNSGNHSALAELPELVELYVHNNAFSGQFPTLQSSSLTVIHCTDNLLNGTVPPLPTSVVTNASVIFLRGNSFTGWIPDHYFNSNFRDLDLSYNLLNGTIPSSITSMELIALDLSHNRCIL